MKNPILVKIFLVIALIVCLFLSLAIVQRIHLFHQRRKTQKSAWCTFVNLAKIRGLVPAAIRALTLATKRAKIKRPSQILASMHVFDKCINEFLYYEKVSLAENASLESARQKLISTVKLHSKYEERRQLARAVAELPIKVHFIPKAWVQQETNDKEGDTEAQF